MIYNYRDDPLLGSALAYWIEKRGERAMPRRRDIDPTEIPRKILPNLQIIEAIDGGARFRWRLVGTASVDAYGSDYTGAYADAIFSDDRLAFIQNIYRSVVRLKTPVFTRNRYHTTKNVDVFANRIYLPLSDDDAEVDHILGILAFQTGGVFAESGWRQIARLDPSGQYIESIDVGQLFDAAAS